MLGREVADVRRDVDRPNPDYAALARAFDGYGEKVTDPAEVRPALVRGLQAVAGGRLALLDMRLQPINTSGEV